MLLVLVEYFEGKVVGSMKEKVCLKRAIFTDRYCPKVVIAQ